MSNDTNDTTRRDALERWIAAQLVDCSLDELRVIGVRVERMAKARAKYGPLDLSADSRDLIREAAEENVDRAFYRDAHYIALQDEGLEQLRDEAALEMRAEAASRDAHNDRTEEGLRELRDAPVEHRRPSALDIDFGEGR